jgi:hypothetical protein
MNFGHMRLNVRGAMTKTWSEYAPVRIDPDADSDSDPENEKGRTKPALGKLEIEIGIAIEIEGHRLGNSPPGLR